MTIGERIKDRRRQLGMTVEELAAKLGKNRATVYRYESGDIKDMPTPVLEPLAKVLETTPAELMGWETYADRFKRTAEIFNRHHAEKQFGNVVAIPILRRVAAGLPLHSYDETIGYECIPQDMASRGNYFALQIKGDSMSPGIADGDIVICREQPDAEDGQVVVALVNGDDGVCKRLHKYPDGSIALLSDNSSYAPMYFNTGEIDMVPVSIRGIVVELRRKF